MYGQDYSTMLPISQLLLVCQMISPSVRHLWNISLLLSNCKYVTYLSNTPIWNIVNLYMGRIQEKCVFRAYGNSKIMTKSSVITNRLSITMAGLIIDHLFSSDEPALFAMDLCYTSIYMYSAVCNDSTGDDNGPDQTVQKRRLICAFTVCIYLMTLFLKAWPISCSAE